MKPSQASGALSPVLEALESRVMFSTQLWHGWPLAPFDSRLTTPVYTNQFGVAELTQQPLTATRQFTQYSLSFDDPGKVRIGASGSCATDLGFYYKTGRPSIRAAPANGTTHIQFVFPADKRSTYITARSSVAGATGTYTLHVAGPAPHSIEAIRVSSVTNAGSTGSDISGTNDNDFYSFRVPRPGNWICQVIPDRAKSAKQPRLDATMMIYDQSGKPVGGTFTKPIDAHGIGKTEAWTGIGLAAGSQYFVRIDGYSDSIGGYGVAVFIADLPTVSLRVADGTATSGKKDTAQFLVSRSDTGKTPLTVHYTLSGTAVAGVDYQSLSGSVVIPANQLSASVIVKPLTTASSIRTRRLTLALSPDRHYNLDFKSAGGVKILSGAT